MKIPLSNHPIYPALVWVIKKTGRTHLPDPNNMVNADAKSIGGFFPWSATIEGFRYWADLSDYYLFRNDFEDLQKIYMKREIQLELDFGRV